MLLAISAVLAFTLACNAPPSLARLPLASVVTNPFMGPCTASELAEVSPGSVTVSLTVPKTIWLSRVVMAFAPIAIENICEAVALSPIAVE